MENTFAYHRLQANMEKYIGIIRPFFKDLRQRLLDYPTKTNDYMHKCPYGSNPTVTTADSQKTTYIYLQNAQEYKKSGHTSNQYLQN